MKRKIDNSGTEPVRIDTSVLNIVRAVKSVTGMPIGRFIENAIHTEFNKLPKDKQKEIMGFPSKIKLFK